MATSRTRSTEPASYAHHDADKAGHKRHSTDKKRFFGNFREASHGSRRDRQAEYYAHEDADNAGHNGHSPDNKQRRCFVLSCPSCPRRVRAFMSVSLSSAGPSLTIQGS